MHKDSGLDHHRPWLGWVLLPRAHGVGLLPVHILGGWSITLRGIGVALWVLERRGVDGLQKIQVGAKLQRKQNIMKDIIS